MTTSKGHSPHNKHPTIGGNVPVSFQKDLEAHKKEDDLYLLSGIEKQVAGVLSEVQYIRQVIGDNKVAPVENINAKIQKSIKKIRELMDPRNDNDPNMAVEAANQQSNDGLNLNLEKNPLLNEMGGMPLEDISPEWSELIEGQPLDKAELENMVNNKLKNRVELANKLKLQNRLTNQPKLKAGAQITPKFEKIQQTMKYIIKEMPPPPAPEPAPRFNPSPFGPGR